MLGDLLFTASQGFHDLPIIAFQGFHDRLHAAEITRPGQRSPWPVLGFF
jgi:hypothetical protein